eukprot:4022645-Amphidinium_carterae.1
MLLSKTHLHKTPASSMSHGIKPAQVDSRFHFGSPRPGDLVDVEVYVAVEVDVVQVDHVVLVFADIRVDVFDDPGASKTISQVSEVSDEVTDIVLPPQSRPTGQSKKVVYVIVDIND